MTVIDFNAERARRQLERHFNPTLAQDLLDLAAIWGFVAALLALFFWII